MTLLLLPPYSSSSSSLAHTPSVCCSSHSICSSTSYARLRPRTQLHHAAALRRNSPTPARYCGLVVASHRKYKAAHLVADRGTGSATQRRAHFFRSPIDTAPRGRQASKCAVSLPATGESLFVLGHLWCCCTPYPFPKLPLEGAELSPKVGGAVQTAPLPLRYRSLIDDASPFARHHEKEKSWSSQGLTRSNSHPDVNKFKPTALKLSKAYVSPN